MDREVLEALALDAASSLDTVDLYELRDCIKATPSSDLLFIINQQENEV